MPILLRRSATLLRLASLVCRRKNTIQFCTTPPEASMSAALKLSNTIESYQVTAEDDKRVYAPAAGRNKQLILEQILKHVRDLETHKTFLEVASGTGEHTALFAAAMPKNSFQPTDLTPDLFDSISAHSLGLPNVCAPKILDASSIEHWCRSITENVDCIVCINMLHISPYAATCGLLEGSGRHLSKGGLLFIYGPFTVDGGRFTTESNQSFDASLRLKNPEWGYRDLEDIKEKARIQGLNCKEVIEMPANNFFLVLQRS